MGVGSHSEGGHRKVERGESVADIEKRVLKGLIDTSPTTVNRGHPATFISTPDGTFLVTVERVSTAVMERADT